MKQTLPELTEDELTVEFGRTKIRRAGQDLAAGFLSQGRQYSNGLLAARWQDGQVNETAFLRGSPETYELLCTCGERDCRHALALCLTWAVRPGDFKPQAAPLAEKELLAALEQFDEADDLDLFDAGLDDDLDLAPEASGAPRQSNAPNLKWEPDSRTLRWVWPVLEEEFELLFGALTVPQMRALAQRYQLRLSGTKRDAILEQLLGALSQPAVYRAAARALSPGAQLLLALLLFVITPGGLARRSDFAKVLADFPPPFSIDLDRYLDELQAAGLLVEPHPGHFAGIPILAAQAPSSSLVSPWPDTKSLRLAPAPASAVDLALRLLLSLRAPQAVWRVRGLAPAPQLPQVNYFDWNDWPHAPGEVEALKRERNPFPVLQNRGLAFTPPQPVLEDAALSGLARRLSAPPELVDLCLRLLAKLGLLVLAPGEPVKLLVDGFQNYLGLAASQQAVLLVSAWLSLREPFELADVLGRLPDWRLAHVMAYDGGYAQAMARLTATRLGLFHFLRRTPPGQWVDLRALVERAQHFNVAGACLPLSNDLAWRAAHNKDPLREPAGWQAAYRAWVETLLAGPLHALGVVDLGYARDQLAAFRLTDLGVFLTYQSETYQPPAAPAAGRALKYAAAGALQVDPAAAGSELMGLLTQLGELQSGAGGTLAFQVTAAGVQRVLESGRSAEQIIAALTEAGGPPPAALADQLRAWQAHFGRVQVYPEVALLELADDYALEELLSTTSLAQHLLYRFSPRLVAVRPEAGQALLDEFRARGHTPKLEAD